MPTYHLRTQEFPLRPESYRPLRGSQQICKTKHHENEAKKTVHHLGYTFTLHPTCPYRVINCRQLGLQMAWSKFYKHPC